MVQSIPILEKNNLECLLRHGKIKFAEINFLQKSLISHMYNLISLYSTYSSYVKASEVRLRPSMKKPYQRLFNLFSLHPFVDGTNDQSRHGNPPKLNQKGINGIGEFVQAGVI